MGVAFPRRVLDDRALLPPVLLTGIALWKLPPAGATVLGLCLALLLARQKGVRHLIVFVVRCAPLGLYWSFMSAASMLITDETWQQSLYVGMEAFGRVFLCFLLGGWLCARCSVRNFALAVEWYMRALFREQSWKIGMALSVMLGVFPSMLRTLRSAWEVTALRMHGQPFWRKASCTALTTLRCLPSETEGLAFALAARRLDSSGPWCDTAPVPPAHLAASVILSLAETALFLL